MPQLELPDVFEGNLTYDGEDAGDYTFRIDKGRGDGSYLFDVEVDEIPAGRAHVREIRHGQSFDVDVTASELEGEYRATIV